MTDRVSFETFRDLYEWCLCKNIEFLTEAFEKYQEKFNLHVNPKSKLGNRKTLHDFYKTLANSIDMKLLESFDYIVSI